MKRIFLLTTIFMMAFTGALVSSSNKPTLSRVYATPYAQEELQYNNVGNQGTLQDAFGVAGSLSIDAQLSGGQARIIQVLTDGTMLVALGKSETNSVVAKYNAQGTLISAGFGTSGVVDLGAETLVPHSMLIDVQNRVLIAGGNDDAPGTSGWLKRFSSAGVLDSSFNANFVAAGVTWQFIGAISQQSSGKIIVVGSNTTHAQIARYNLNGTLDATFGVLGKIVFDGAGGRPTSTNGLYNIVTDSSNNLYVLYLQGSTAKVAKFDIDGTLVSGFGTAGVVTVDFLASAAVATTCIAIDLAGDLVVGAATSGSVSITNLLASNGSYGGFALSTGEFSNLHGIIPTSDGKIILIGSDPAHMAVMRLTSSGELDESTEGDNVPFNTTGFNLFNIAGGDITSSVLYGASVAPNGQLYVVGYQTASDVTTPYISCLYDAPFVNALQQFPLVQEQGVFDTTFGTHATQSFRGVEMPYHGNFGAGLQQQTAAITELLSGDFLVGSYGNTDYTANKTMMLTWLTPTGALDTDFGSGTGKLILPNVSSSDETMAALAVGSSDLIYIAGSNATPFPFIRSYSSTGSAISALNDTGISAVGIAIQGTAGILLFAADSSTTGHISRYTNIDGTLALDTENFGTSGKIATSDFGLNMGPVYGGGLVNSSENIIIAYQNSLTEAINVAMINKNGTALVSEFGAAGIAPNVLNSLGLDGDNVRMAFDEHENIYVAGRNSDNTRYIITRLNGQTGIVDPAFNSGSVATIDPGFTSLILTNLTGVSDGKVMLTGFASESNPVMLTMRVASIGNVASLDATFNSQGATPGVVPMQIENEVANYNARVATDVAIQSNSGMHGNLMYSAYEKQTSSQSTPEIFSLFGASGTTQVQRFPITDQQPGTLDISLAGVGAYAVDLVEGQATAVYAYPNGNVHEGLILLGMDAGTDILIARVNQTTLAYDTTFNPDGDVPGILQIQNLSGLENIMVDGDNNIIINGTNAIPQGWARRISNDGLITIAFNMPSDIISTHMVYQQQSGRYIVTGSTNTIGTMVAFQDVVVAPAAGLAVDTSFNPLAFIPGRYNVIGSTSLYSLAINVDDSIYAPYKDVVTNVLTIAKVVANGAGLDQTFNASSPYSGKLATVIIPDSTAVVRLVLDSSNNVIVAASCDDAASLKAFRCNVNGGTSTQFTIGGIVGFNHVATLSTAPLTAGVVLHALLEDEDGKTILVGSNSSSSRGAMFAVRLATTGDLDTTWNPSPTSPDIVGVLTFGATDVPLTPAITIMNNATISVPGSIFAVGGNGTNPVLMKIVGDSYVTGVPQGQYAGAAGTFDVTLSPSEGGSLNLVVAGLGLVGYVSNKLYIYPDGSMLLGASNGVNTILTKVDATLALDATFNHGSILNLGINTAELNNMFVHNAAGEDGSIYVTGSNSGVLWSYKISADGLTIAPCTTIGAWTAGNAIRKAANDNIVIAGFDGTYGAVASLFPNGAALDSSFGVDGVYATASTNPIMAMAVDNLGRIYIGYVNSESGYLLIQRLTSAGTLDATFAADPIAVPDGGMAWVPNMIKLALDVANNQIVLAANLAVADNSNKLSTYRFSTIDGSATGHVDIAITDDSGLNLSDLLMNTDQQIYVVGDVYFGTNVGNAIVGRLASTSATTIALDTTYGIAGIANVTAGSITSIGGGALDPDGRAYVVGFSDTIPYMGRLFNNNYFAQVSQAYASSTLGQLDYSYGIAGIAANFADGQTLPSANQQVRTILPLTTGTDILTIIGDGVDSWTVRLLPDGTNDSAYGDGQGIEIVKTSLGNELVQGMVFDGSGNTIVFGSNSSAGSYVKSILPSGSMNTSFGGFNGNPAGTTYNSQLSIINSVAQLSDGSYIFVGSKANVGKIGKLSSNGVLDSSFGIKSFGTNIASISVDALDNIYIGYATLASSVIRANVAKLDATGALVSDFGSNGVVSDIITNVDNAANMRSVLDAEGKIVVAASGDGVSASVGLRRLNTDGSFDTDFNSGLTFEVPFGVGTSAVVTSLSTLQNGNIYIAGYQFDPIDADNNDYEFVAAITNAGALDTNFNAMGATPGISTFQIAMGEQTGRNVWNMNVQDNGQILLAGSEGPEDGGQLPFTMRVNGYPGVKAIPQFIGAVPSTPSDIDSSFGIVYTFPAISTLIDGGSNAVDSQGRILIGGITSDHTFVVARFLSDGTLDPDFKNGSNDGIAQTPVISTLSSGAFITVDSDDNVYVSGMASDLRLIVAKFLGLSGHLDPEFNAAASSPLVPGITQSVVIPNLVSGGSSAIDASSAPGRIVLGGITSTHRLVAARFTSVGEQDLSFDSDGVAVTPEIATLRDGGYVAVAQASELFPVDNSVYVGGSTYDKTLIIARFLENGTLDTAGFNHLGAIPGIAATGELTNLLRGGLVALDSNRNVVVGGFTADKMFVAAAFTTLGVADVTFSDDGIAYSNGLSSLDSCEGIAVDSNNNILLGGTSTAFDGISKSMVVTRFTSHGLIDTTFTSTGLATTGVISGLEHGGFVAVNGFDNPFLGGYDGTKLVLAGLYSGAELFIDPSTLPASSFKVFWYGNDINRFKDFFGINFYAQNITDTSAQEDFITQINDILDNYAEFYASKPNFNLAASTVPALDTQFDNLKVLLILAHPESEDELGESFTLFNNRRIALRSALLPFSNR